MGRLEPNLHEYNIGHVEDLIRLGFGDLALIFKVTAELNRSNLSMCGGGGRIKTILVAFYFCPWRFLAHLSRRLMGELIVYQSLRRPSSVR